MFENECSAIDTGCSYQKEVIPSEFICGVEGLPPYEVMQCRHCGSPPKRDSNIEVYEIKFKEVKYKDKIFKVPESTEYMITCSNGRIMAVSGYSSTPEIVFDDAGFPRSWEAVGDQITVGWDNDSGLPWFLSSVEV